MKFTINVEMQERWIPYFLGMLKTMQILGDIGSSRIIKFNSDGDGDFRPKFDWDIDVDHIKIKKYQSNGKWNGEMLLDYDAG